MRIYLAGRYGRREELCRYASSLLQSGFIVTSRWLKGEGAQEDQALPRSAARKFAAMDVRDLEEADALVAFTEGPEPVAGGQRGGRHAELGYALGQRKRVFVVGPLENLFCHLPEVEQYDMFGPLLERLVAIK